MSHAHAVPPAPQRTVTTAETGSFQVTTVSSDATRATVQLQGEMDLANAGLLSAVLADHLTCGRRYLRLDVSQLTFLDCTGLRVLVEAHNQCLAARGSLILTGVGTRIALLLRITHFDEALLVANEPGEPRRVPHLTTVPTGGTL